MVILSLSVLCKLFLFYDNQAISLTAVLFYIFKKTMELCPGMLNGYSLDVNQWIIGMYSLTNTTQIDRQLLQPYRACALRVNNLFASHIIQMSKLKNKIK